MVPFFWSTIEIIIIIIICFLDTRTCENCKEILEELEKIDDDANKYGVEFVKNSERAASKKYGINQFPQLVYFRHGEPTIYEGLF